MKPAIRVPRRADGGFRQKYQGKATEFQAVGHTRPEQIARLDLRVGPGGEEVPFGSTLEACYQELVLHRTGEEHDPVHGRIQADGGTQLLGSC
jgi:hypothetical protein